MNSTKHKWGVTLTKETSSEKQGDGVRGRRQSKEVEDHPRWSRVVARSPRQHRDRTGRQGKVLRLASRHSDILSWTGRGSGV